MATEKESQALKETKEILRQLKNFGLSDEAVAARMKVTGMTARNWREGKHAANYATREKLLLIIAGLKRKAK